MRLWPATAVYSGTLNWVTGGKDNLEDFSNNDFWIGSTINYVIFRPGDNKVFHSGVLASVLGSDFDYQDDHAIYPEVVWNDATRQWIVTWEERKPAFDITCYNPGCRGIYRYARTVDKHGALGPVHLLGRCWDDNIETLISGEDNDDEPPPLPLQKDYCYFINAANDHYSADGVPLADRNPMHYTLHDSYMYEFFSSNIPRWLVDNGESYAENVFDQAYDTHPHIANIAVIDYWDTAFFGYPNASYLMFKSIQYQNPVRVQNEFFLVVDQPDHWFTPPTYPNQVGPQQFYHETAGTIDFTTSRRIPWAVSSSILSFMALWTQFNMITGKMDLKYGNYYFIPE